MSHTAAGETQDPFMMARRPRGNVVFHTADTRHLAELVSRILEPLVYTYTAFALPGACLTGSMSRNTSWCTLGPNRTT